MSRPTPEHIREVITTLRNHDWKELERKLLDALHKDAAGLDNADGYPRGGRGSSPSDCHLNSVEGAASARIAGQKDILRDHLEHAIDFLYEGNRAIGAFTRRMNLIDTVIGTPPNTKKICESHARIQGQQIKPEIYGTVNGRLHKPMDLCRPCYDIVIAHGRLPTVDELADQIRRGRFYIRRTG